MSTFVITDFTVRFDGHGCKMGGVGGVSTLPQYRRRGGIRGCFEAALPHMYENGYDFSYLYPFSTAYYRKFGFENCVQKLQVTVDLGLLSTPAAEGTFRLAEPRSPQTEAIRALDAAWEERYNMMVLHGADHYKWTEKLDPAAGTEYTYVCYGAENAPTAYTTFRLENQSDGRNLVCSRFCFRDREGFYGLMQVFKSLAADHRYVKFAVPNSAAMQYLLPEWSLGAAQWAVQPAGMVRVVNVQSALEKARYRGSGRTTLAVRDGQIPQNNGTFAVTFENDRAVSVVPTEGAPDGVFTIPAFSALLAGVSDWPEAGAWLPGVEVRNGAAPLESVFYRKPMMLVDYF